MALVTVNEFLLEPYFTDTLAGLQRWCLCPPLGKNKFTPRRKGALLGLAAALAWLPPNLPWTALSWGRTHGALHHPGCPAFFCLCSNQPTQGVWGMGWDQDKPMVTHAHIFPLSCQGSPSAAVSWGRIGVLQWQSQQREASAPHTRSTERMSW